MAEGPQKGFKDNKVKVLERPKPSSQSNPESVSGPELDHS